jgi:hypothetical protein
MAFRVGQKVVCVDAGPLVNDAGFVSEAKSLQEGTVYTVTDLFERNGVKALKLAEASPEQSGRIAFNARRFRPVVERKTDISIFIAMLNPEQVQA